MEEMECEMGKVRLPRRDCNQADLIATENTLHVQRGVSWMECGGMAVGQELSQHGAAKVFYTERAIRYFEEGHTCNHSVWVF